MRTLSLRERKLVAVLVLLALLGTIWTLLVAPVLAGFSERAARRELLTRQYQLNQRTIGSIPRLRRQAERQRDTLRDFVLTGPTPAATAIVLQERVQRTIETVGGEVRAIEDATADETKLRARASARMTLAQMTATLARLQNEPPFLAVDAVNVTADQAAISGRLETMEVSLEVSAPYILAKSR